MPLLDGCDHVSVRPTDEEFRAAWPRVVRVLAAWSGSLDDAEEYAAEAMSRAVTAERIDDLSLVRECGQASLDR
jgi:DNA-directed RNA polymerase specialized sigma24 family protein